MILFSSLMLGVVLVTSALMFLRKGEPAPDPFLVLQGERTVYKGKDLQAAKDHFYEYASSGTIVQFFANGILRGSREA